MQKGTIYKGSTEDRVTGTDYLEKRLEINKAYASADFDGWVGSSRVDLQACKLEYSIVSPK